MTRSRCHGYVWAGAMLWGSAACGGSPPPPGAIPGQASTASSGAPDARGMDVKPAPSGAPSEIPSPSGAAPDAPFVVEARLRAHRTRNGRTITFDDVHSGDSVLDGDRLQLSVRASGQAYLYLGFCSQHAGDPRYHGLSVFPETGSIQIMAHETVTVPTTEIVLDNKPGQETLYLIVSRVELSDADAELANVIAIARQGKETVDCGAPLHSAMAGPSKGGKLRPDRSGGGRGSADPKPRPAAGPKPPARPANTGGGRPPVDIERGGDIVSKEGAQPGVEADLEGIVVLRYELQHAPAPPANRPSGAHASL